VKTSFYFFCIRVPMYHHAPPLAPSENPGYAHGAVYSVGVGWCACFWGWEMPVCIELTKPDTLCPKKVDRWRLSG